MLPWGTFEPLSWWAEATEETVWRRYDGGDCRAFFNFVAQDSRKDVTKGGTERTLWICPVSFSCIRYSIDGAYLQGDQATDRVMTPRPR